MWRLTVGSEHLRMSATSCMVSRVSGTFPFSSRGFGMGRNPTGCTTAHSEGMVRRNMATMPSSRWDTEVYCPTVVAPRATFDKVETTFGDMPLHYGPQLVITDADLTEMLRLNARGHWPPSAYVETDRVVLGRSEPDGVARVGRASRDLVHGVKLRFTLIADEQPPAEAWGSWNLRRFTKADDG